MGKKRQGKAQERRALEEAYQRDLEEWYFKWDFDRDGWTTKRAGIFKAHIPRTWRELGEVVAHLRLDPYPGRRELQRFRNKVLVYRRLAARVLRKAGICVSREEAENLSLLFLEQNSGVRKEHLKKLQQQPMVATAYLLLLVIHDLKEFGNDFFRIHGLRPDEVFLRVVGAALAVGRLGEQLRVRLSRTERRLEALPEARRMAVEERKSKAYEHAYDLGKEMADHIKETGCRPKTAAKALCKRATELASQAGREKVPVSVSSYLRSYRNYQAEESKQDKPQASPAH